MSAIWDNPSISQEVTGFDAMVGQVIDGRYRVESKLGEGGMGLVYRVQHVELGKALVMKVLRPEANADPVALARFRREAQSLSAIGNEHIVDIHDFGTLPNGTMFFTMDYLEGRTLTEVLKSTDGVMPVPRAMHIAQQLCRALGAAHEQGVVHRDLKPDNIFLVRNARAGGIDTDFVKVLDFGVAKKYGEDYSLTQTGQAIGTPYYMSPEQCRGRDVDHRTDIYSLGVLMYQMLAGKLPFEADNFASILALHCVEDPRPLSELVPGISREVEDTVLWCLEKDADDRFESMYALGEEIQRVQPNSFYVPLLPSTYSGVRAASDTDVKKRRASPWRWIAAATVSLFAVAALAVLLGWWVVRSGGSPSSSASSAPDELAQQRASALMDTWIHDVLRTPVMPKEGREHTEKAIAEMQVLLTDKTLTEASRTRLIDDDLNQLYKQLAVHIRQGFHAELARIWEDIPRCRKLAEKAVQDVEAVLNHEHLTESTKAWLKDNTLQVLEAALGSEIHRSWKDAMVRAGQDAEAQRRVTDAALINMEALVASDVLTPPTKASLNPLLVMLKERQTLLKEAALREAAEGAATSGKKRRRHRTKTRTRRNPWR